MIEAAEQGATVAQDAEANENLAAAGIEEVVADKGYHSNDVVRDLSELGMWSYISEPEWGRRRWRGPAYSSTPSRDIGWCRDVYAIPPGRRSYLILGFPLGVARHHTRSSDGARRDRVLEARQVGRKGQAYLLVRETQWFGRTRVA